MRMISLLKPSVNKNVLLILAGVLWSGVGIMLNKIAYHWLVNLTQTELIFSIIGGIILATIITIWGFSKIVKKNLYRIDELPDKVCLFAFQAWKSYIIIIIMICLGIFLRSFKSIPKPVLASIYIGIGGALFLCSFLYYKSLFKNNKVT